MERPIPKKKNWRLFAKEELARRDDGTKYLTRYALIDTPWFGIWIHRMHGPDPDTMPHDHPFSFLTIGLWGSYTEESYKDNDHVTMGFLWADTDTISPLSIRLRRNPYLHKIVEVAKGTTTFVIRGPRKRRWGFVNDDGEWIDAEDHLKQEIR